MSTQPNVGDVVRLKSGGPTMTVKSIETIEFLNKPAVIMVACQWFHDNETRENEFPSDSIEQVSEQS